MNQIAVAQQKVDEAERAVNDTRNEIIQVLTVAILLNNGGVGGWGRNRKQLTDQYNKCTTTYQ